MIIDPAAAGPSAEPAEDPTADVLHELALTLLARRPWTRKQLVAALRRRGYDPCAVMEEVYGLEHVGLVDDAAFAREYLSRRGLQRGRRALSQELRAKGIERDVVTRTLEDRDAGADEQAARALIGKRLPAMAGLPLPVRQRRLAGQLARRGFDSGLIARLLRQLPGAADEPGGLPD